MQTPVCPPHAAADVVACCSAAHVGIVDCVISEVAGTDGGAANCNAKKSRKQDV